MHSVPDELNTADRTLHSLAQFIALSGTNWLPNRADDSHTNMVWNSDRHRLEGRPFDRDGQPIRLVIDTAAFSLQYIDQQGKPVASFMVENQTPNDATAWWQTLMHSWGIGDLKGLNYRLEEPPVADDTPYTRPLGMAGWEHWRTLAHSALNALSEASGQASEIRIWPHHFDTGVYYSLPDSTGSERAAIWAGYAIADAVSREPYFYLSGYNSQSAIDFTTAHPLTAGTWLATPAWQGAILPVSAVTGVEQVTQFLRESYAWVMAKTGE